MTEKHDSTADVRLSELLARTAAHSPGPWRTEVLGHNLRVVANHDGEFGDDVAGIGDFRVTVNRGNARLIAAAPELLAALHMCIEHMEWTTTFGEAAYQNARRAFSRAVSEG